MSTALEREPIAASDAEQLALSEIEQLLKRNPTPQTLMLIGPHGDEIRLPTSVVRALSQVVNYMRQNKAVTLVPVDQELTTQQAADLLSVSRPYLIKLLEKGVIPFAKVGTHRRIRYCDVMAYKQLRGAQQQEALDRLTQLNQEMGLYDA